MMHFFWLFLNELLSALLPNTRPSAPIKIDLPAPVSPVMMFNPLPKLISTSDIKAKFLTFKFNNIIRLQNYDNIINYFDKNIIKNL